MIILNENDFAVDDKKREKLINLIAVKIAFSLAQNWKLC
jgi:hypothetical protein